MPPRYTIRQVVGTYRRKAFGTCNDDGSPRRPAYPADAIVAFYGMLELAEEQPRRGWFESARLLRVLLEGPDGKGRRYSRQVPFLVAQGDLVEVSGGALVVEGWEILQEGDTTIADRVSRFRTRKRNGPANATGNGPANGDANGDVTVGLTEDPRAGDDARVATRPQRRGDGYQATARRLPGAGDARDDDDVGSVLSWLAKERSTSVPEGAGLVELARLVNQHGVPAVIAALGAQDASMKDGRQYVFGAMKSLNPLPRNGTAEPIVDPKAEERKRQADADRRLRQRVERYRSTGIWMDEWGPRPDARTQIPPEPMPPTPEPPGGAA